jgi:hypothetical protein
MTEQEQNEIIIIWIIITPPLCVLLGVGLLVVL